jgi:hypothetical protein
LLHDKLSDFASDFGLFRLHATLTELNCDGSTQSRLISWYWRASKLWSADSQAEFDAIAESEIRSAVDRLDRNAEIVQRHTSAVKAGLKRSIPARLRSESKSTTGIVDDATQDAWTRLFRDVDVDARTANNAGRSAGRDEVRKRLREVPVSQLNLPDADSEDPAPPEERDGLFPWDKVDPSDRSRSNLDEQVWAFLRDGQDDLRRNILNEFRRDAPDDYDFIVEYVSRLRVDVVFRRGRVVPLSKRGARLTQQERNRAKAILDRLRRTERKALDAGF